MPDSKTWAAILMAVLLLLPKAGHAQTGSSVEASARTQVVEQVVALGLQIHETALDCSHFVNALFETIGLGYEYQPSRALYQGNSAFKRIHKPETGDLIVWPGHVGIVVDPEQKTFVSALRTGVKVASYTSRYWQHRGHPRFLRYRLPTTSTLAWQAKAGPEFDVVNRSGTE